jgi:hypothetical protein
MEPYMNQHICRKYYTPSSSRGVVVMIICKVVSLNQAHDEVYSTQQYVIQLKVYTSTVL